MTALRALLEICCYVAPIAVVLRAWRRQQGITVDHVFLFSAGFIFYFVLPLTLGRTDYFAYYQTIYLNWRVLFDGLGDSTWIRYFAASLVLYAAFIAGDVVAARMNAGAGWRRLSLDGRVVNAIGGLGILTALMMGVPFYAYFFAGYLTSTQFPALGTFTATTILILSVAVITTIAAWADRPQQVGRALRNPFVYAYVGFALLLTSMGGRLILLSSLSMLLVFYSTYVRRLALGHTLAALFILVVCSQLILVFREPRWGALASELMSGRHEQWWTAITYPLAWNGHQFFSENFNVSYSLLDFLTTHSLSLVRLPITLATGLVSLVPSMIFPGKSLFVIDFEDLGYPVQSPAGGMHVFVSMMIGFGFLGAVVFLFLLSLLLRCLRQAAGPLYASMYVMLSGWLGMMFFRDLQQVAIKEMLQFSILVPLTIAAASAYLRRKQAMASTASV